MTTKVVGIGILIGILSGCGSSPSRKQADTLPASVPEQAAPVYAYVKALLSDDIESFKKAHTKRALTAYEQAGGIEEVLPKIKTEFAAKFHGVTVGDFTFTAHKEKYAVPGGPVELDGEYFMVKFNVEKIGGGGVFVEREDKQWKITIPRYKNLDEIIKKAKQLQESTSNQVSEPSVAPAPPVQH